MLPVPDGVCKEELLLLIEPEIALELGVFAFIGVILPELLGVVMPTLEGLLLRGVNPSADMVEGEEPGDFPPASSRGLMP